MIPPVQPPTGWTSTSRRPCPVRPFSTDKKHAAVQHGIESRKIYHSIRLARYQHRQPVYYILCLCLLEYGRLFCINDLQSFDSSSPAPHFSTAIVSLLIFAPSNGARCRSWRLIPIRQNWICSRQTMLSQVSPFGKLRITGSAKLGILLRRSWSCQSYPASAEEAGSFWETKYMAWREREDATRNKCIATSNKCLTSSNKDATRTLYMGLPTWNQIASATATRRKRHLIGRIPKK